jgi:dolichol-phosphate mannosyltransferase
MSRPRLTVVVPVYNERETILTVLGRVRELEVDKELVVVDNCSTDGTRELLAGLPRAERLPGRGSMRIVLQPRNMGKGTSVRTGIAHARGEYVVIQDADLEYDPRDILRLLTKAEEGHEVVFGSRVASAGFREGGAFSLGRRLVTLWFNLLFGVRVTDIATCYKFARTELLAAIPWASSGFDLDFEIPARLARRGIRIVEIPISYDPRSLAEGKKITWRDGLAALWTLLRFRVSRP